MKRKILIVFGTRPEAIKMAPLVKEIQKYPKDFELRVCVTAQHREMLDQVLTFFEIAPDYDLNIMTVNQNLFSLTADIITGIRRVLESFNADYIFVHGDTTTSTITALAGFYAGIKVCHVEAGLRTYNKLAPFPEEMNRQLTGRLADFHFAPTVESKNNLLKESVPEERIIVTGNTVIDSLLESVKKVNDSGFRTEEIESLKKKINTKQRIILVTGHRRENFGAGFIEVCEAFKQLVEQHNDVQIIYPVHLNPNVRNIVYEILDGVPNILLIDPLSYPTFVWLMDKAQIIITDSGGIQEEAPSLGKPVLVMRETTERPEAVNAGTVLLVGTSKDKIIKHTTTLLRDKSLYNKMSELHNPYGDGNASRRIVDFLLKN